MISPRFVLLCYPENSCSMASTKRPHFPSGQQHPAQEVCMLSCRNFFQIHICLRQLSLTSDPCNYGTWKSANISLLIPSWIHHGTFWHDGSVTCGNLSMTQTACNMQFQHNQQTLSTRICRQKDCWYIEWQKEKGVVLRVRIVMDIQRQPKWTKHRT